MLPAFAQQQISMIVATTPGTGVDTLAREVGQQFLALRNTVVVVENKPGASGNIGASYVARAKPDGNTLLVAATTFATNATLNAPCPMTRSRISCRSPCWGRVRCAW